MATPISYQFGLLPERRMDWRTFATSYGLEILIIFLLLNVGLLIPERIQLNGSYRITELIPIPVQQPEVYTPKAPAMHAKLLPPAVVHIPKMIVPPEVEAPRPQIPAPPKVVVVNNFSPSMVKIPTGGARPSQIVHTGEFGSSAAPTLNLPAPKVQTGGFGDPNGIPGQGKPNPKLAAANTGSFDLPPGPGQGNGAGGATGVKGTIASAGFGNGIAQPGKGDGRVVQPGGFGSQQVAHLAKPKLAADGPATRPVEILFKPNPTYTEEARAAKLEGEVLLEVMFGANGQLQVNHVVRGLGHGLDEAAVVATNRMRFRPAMHDGQPVDSTAIVHVVFQLAY